MKPNKMKLLAALGFFAMTVTLPVYSIASEGGVYSQSGDVTSDSAVLWGRCNLEQHALLTFMLATDQNMVASKQHSIVRKKSHKVTDRTDFTG